MSYRLARSLALFRDECNRRWPSRDKASDGWIADAKHSSRSDHSPWVKDSRGVGVVRAFDLDAGHGGDREVGLWLAEHVRNLGLRDHPALRAGAYVISARRIASDARGWAWRPYTGSNPHTSHTHVSVGTAASSYDSAHPWDILGTGGVPPKAVSGNRMMKLEDPMMRGDDVRTFQVVTRAWYPFLNIAVDGIFGKQSDGAAREVQRRAGLKVDGVVGPATKRVLNI